jgi:hypothetical protein
MRIQIQTTGRTGGNILLVTLLTCFILGMSLASYLTLVSSQNYSVMRSLAWNAAIPLVEAGAEEALTQLHHHGSPGTNAVAYQSNGWAADTAYGGSYYMRRVLADCYYEVWVTPSDPPVIYSHGYVPVPLRTGASVGMLLASLTENQTQPTSYVKRQVRLNTRSSALFAKGLVADGQIDLKGNNITTDSFDSLNPLYSDNGKYPAGIPDRLRYAGDVATNSGLVNSLNVGNANIRGTVATGPGGTVAIGPNGTVGDASWHEAGEKGIMPGASSDDMNVDFKDVVLPSFSSGYSTPAGGTVDGVYYDYILGPGAHEVSNLSGNVLVTGDAVLHVTHQIQFTGTDALTIAPTSNLTIYMSGASAAFGGNGEWNENGSALNLQYWGLPSNTSVSVSGNGSFTGTIYAPQAELTLNGGGKDNYDFVGASISKTIQLNGKVQFHYDEALARVGPNRGYIVNSWNEL